MYLKIMPSLLKLNIWFNLLHLETPSSLTDLKLHLRDWLTVALLPDWLAAHCIATLMVIFVQPRKRDFLQMKDYAENSVLPINR